MFFEKPSLSSGSLARGEAAGLGEVYDAAVESTRFVDNVNARVRGLEEAYDARIDGVEKATGVRLVNPYRSAVGSTAGAFGLDQETGDPHAFFQSELERLAENRPQFRDAIAPHRPVLDEAIKKARDKEQTLGDVMSRTPGWSKYGALFAGSFRAGLEDPANLGTMFLGPGGSVGQGAKAVLWMGVKAGAANAAVETSLQPFVQAWRAEAGLDYGLSTAALNIATAGALGFGLDAGIRGGYRAVQSARGVKPVDALDAAARAAPEGSPLRRAADGDPAALNDLATAAGVADDPAMRGARMALETDIDSRIAGVEDGDHYDALINALRAADDPDAVPVKGADATPEARGPVLADDVPPPGARFEKDGKPVTFRSFTPEQLTADPAVFQFRRQVNSAGTTGRMAGIQVWDPMASGKAVVFQRRSGEYVIADGHHRLELAKRLADQKPELQGYLFREADGWTADDVRAYAAKKNMMDSPRVDPIDAASALRARPDLIDKSVAVGDETMRQARALARLSDEAFGMVVGGVLPPNYAALVGDLMPDKSRHASLVAELAGVEPANVREARFALAEIMALPTTAETQATLFGAFRFERSLMKERMGVLDAALRSLKDDKKVFALLDREAGRIEAAGNKLDEAGNAARMEEAARLSGVIEQLAVTRGPVSDWLSDAARAVAAGMTKKQAADAFARRVASTLETDGLRGLMADEAPLRAGGFDEPLGPEAQAQIKGLEASLAREIEAATKPEKAAERQAVLFDMRRPRAIEDIGPDDPHPAVPLLVKHGTGAIDFSKFDPSRSADLGVHFGSAEQANNRAQMSIVFDRGEARPRVIPAVLDVSPDRVVTLPDLEDWPPLAVAQEIEKVWKRARGNLLKAGVSSRVRQALEAAGSGVSRAERDRVGHTALRGALTDVGIDAIRYQNAAEGGGWSYIVWSPNKVRSATTGDVLLDVNRAVHTPAAARQWGEIAKEIIATIPMLPRDVRLRVEENLVLGGQGADGMWDGFDRIVYVSLAAADPVRTVRHEVVHALRQSGLMSDAEFDTLYKFADRLGLRGAYEIDKLYKANYSKLYGDQGEAYVEALLREETIANMFADYSVNGRRFGEFDGGGVIDQIIGEIVRFMKELRDKLLGYGFRHVTDIFEDIESGRMARRSMRQVALPGGAQVASMAANYFDDSARQIFKKQPSWFDDYHGLLWKLYTKDLVYAKSDAEFETIVNAMHHDSKIDYVAVHEIADSFHEAASALNGGKWPIPQNWFDRFYRIEMEIIRKSDGDRDFSLDADGAFAGTSKSFKDKYMRGEFQPKEIGAYQFSAATYGYDLGADLAAVERIGDVKDVVEACKF